MSDGSSNGHRVTGAAPLTEIAGLISTMFPWCLRYGSPVPQAKLKDDLNLDSLHLVELQVAVEDHFRIRFDPADHDFLGAFTTVGGLAGYVEAKVGALQ